jgi:MYXO-CTERM domain-containing protein
MKRLLFLVVLCTPLATATAATVSFTDSASLLCGTNASCAAGAANSLTFASTLLGGPSLTVTYVAGGDTQDAPPEASANFGALAVSCAGCTAANAARWDLNGALGTVSFSQVLPVPGLNTLSGTFSSGAFGWNGPSGANGAQTGAARFLFAPASMAIGSISYSVEQPAAGVLLQLGQNSVSGLVNVSVVPEPATSALWLSGLAALACLRRRRIVA